MGPKFQADFSFNSKQFYTGQTLLKYKKTSDFLLSLYFLFNHFAFHLNFALKFFGVGGRSKCFLLVQKERRKYFAILMFPFLDAFSKTKNTLPSHSFHLQMIFSFLISG